jgi:hypothetical protein
MTRFHSRAAALAASAFLLVACAGPSGQPATGFVSREAAAAYIPLHGSKYVVLTGEAAAVSLGGGIAVTNAHTANLVNSRDVIGTSRDYDLMFFHTERSAVLATAAPREGARVIAYGQYEEALRIAEGNVTHLDAPVEPNCDGCAVQSAFTFEGNAGPGFSGGPVLDPADGKLVGIVFGYTDGDDGRRTIYAYTMARVNAELRKIEDKLPVDPD